MTELFIGLAIVAACLGFLEYKRPGTIQGWIDKAKSLRKKGP